mmetsp:Transcript_17718/g.54977  ORF Transcript_17718/g.54977 Transcript_17718/m.54977 type:complete len:691 (-) Transcript_17718:167-2239(-)|eukprot:CAMPEP_0174851486 /NCGR_PEP_ID=MMETSP1114-20130205/23215_1 /TAXON_ID=312471 /ORGANISM="Neobodo designis, Strain CCAP 1951/1" /LENGTH=690 /DNA_ID=CAMNT_0016086025 /DNA_START=436 /DNA_END=2508 /DNA_ORIENTATION=+
MRQVIVIVAAVVTIVAVGLSVGLTQVADDAQARLDEQRKTSSEAANVWQERVSQQLYAVVSTAFSLGGFAMGTFDAIPNHNSTNVTERMQFLAPNRFTIFCAELNANIPGLLSLQLQSSGVITQAYPPGSAPIGLDLLNHEFQSADVYRAIDAQGTVVAGPFELFQGGQGIIVRYPIFSVQNAANKSIATWWGNSAIVMRVREFLRDIQIDADMVSRDQHYALWFVDATGARVLMGNSTGADVEEIVEHGEVRRISLPNGNFWSLGTMPRAGFDNAMSPVGVVLSVFLTAGVAAVVAAMLAAGFAWYAKITRSTANAPTEPPLYITFTDIESSTQLWAAAPEEMPDVIAHHADIIRDAIKAHGGYEVKTIGDSFMIATNTCEQALKIITTAQEGLIKSEWPATIKHFYDCDYLRVRAGVHKCTDVNAAFDEVSKGFDYYGNDVNYAARVESVAWGGEVIVSSEVQKEVEKLGLAYSLFEMGSAELKGIDGPQPLFRLTVPGLINRREKIDAADLAAVSERDTSSMSMSELKHSDSGSSVRSAVYNLADDSHAVPELVFAAVGHSAIAQNPEQVDSMVLLCNAHHEAFIALLAPFKGNDRTALLKTFTGKFGVACDGVCVARLAVRIGMINHRRLQQMSGSQQGGHVNQAYSGMQSFTASPNGNNLPSVPSNAAINIRRKSQQNLNDTPQE